MPNLGPTEIIVIIAVLVILFGWKKLPDAARSLGRSMRIFKAEVEEMKDKDKPSAASRETVSGEARRETRTETRTETHAETLPPEDHRVATDATATQTTGTQATATHATGTPASGTPVAETRTTVHEERVVEADVPAPDTAAPRAPQNDAGPNAPRDAASQYRPPMA